MVNQITDDALAPTMGNDEIIKFSSKDKKVQDELDKLKKRKIKGITEYLIKWKNSPNSWEKESDLIEDGLEDIIDIFNGL